MRVRLPRPLTPETSGPVPTKKGAALANRAPLTVRYAILV